LQNPSPALTDDRQNSYAN